MFVKRLTSGALLLCIVLWFFVRRKDAPIVNEKDGATSNRQLFRNPDAPSTGVWERDLLRFFADQFYQRDPTWRALPSPPEAEIHDWPITKKVTVIADVHGDFEATARLLETVGVINRQGQWSYDDNILIMLGDFCDRGHNSPAIFEFLWRLREQAEEGWGGRLIQLYGNHEVMNMVNATYYVSPKEIQLYYTTWTGEDGVTPDETCPGGRYHWPLWNPVNGYIGANIVRTFFAGYQIGDLVCTHAGLVPPYSSVRSLYDLTAVNKQNIVNQQRAALRGEGPFLTRILSQGEEYEICPILNQALRDRNATTQVVGHTFTEKPGLIEFRCNQNYIMLDTRNSRQMGGDLPTAIEITVDYKNPRTKGGYSLYNRHWSAIQTSMSRGSQSKTVIKQDIVCFSKSGHQLRPCDDIQSNQAEL